MLVKNISGATILRNEEKITPNAEFEVTQKELKLLKNLVEVLKEDDTEEVEDQRTIPELKEVLDSLEIKYDSKAKRDELLALVLEAEK